MNLPIPNSWARHWEQFWYAPGSPENLAVARIVFGATSLWVLLSRNFAGVAALPPAFWSGVPATGQWRYLEFRGQPRLEHGLEWTALILLVFVVVGVLPRLSCFLAGLLLYHLAPLETIIWTPNPYARGLTTAVLALLTLSFSPCGDRWSLHLSRDAQGTATDPSDYTWPMRLIQLFVVQIYFFSGIAKIRHSGWAWSAARNLRGWFLYSSQQDQMAVFHSLGNWLAHRPVLCEMIGAGTLVFELGFITVLFSKTLRRVLVPAAAVFHVLILLSLNLFFANIPQLLVFAEWGRRPSSKDLSHSPIPVQSVSV